MILFGMEIARLFLAIAQVESECGRTSENIYQLRQIYLADCNRILGNAGKLSTLCFRLEDAKDQRRSEDAMRVYWTYYGGRYAYLTGNAPTLEVLARIHNGGPDGWRNPETLGYWAKVFTRLQVIDADTALAWVRGGYRDFLTRREIDRITENKERTNENGSKRNNRNRPRVSHQRASHRSANKTA